MSIQDHDFTTLEGFALGGTSVAQNQLGPYIQQAIDQVRQLDIRWTLGLNTSADQFCDWRR